MMQNIPIPLRPVGSRVLVEPAVPDVETVNGVVIPQRAQKAKHEGRVLGLGPAVPPNCGFAVGDRVVVNHYATTEVGVNGKAYRLVLPEDIFAVFNP